MNPNLIFTRPEVSATAPPYSMDGGAGGAGGEVSVEVPEYFVCPISLQIMKDPVTAASGITYDRDSIEKWLLDSGNTICPVTKQTLPGGGDHLTPNHTLRRLIQAWCTANNFDRIPTPKPPLTRCHVMALIGNLSSFNLKKLQAHAAESDRNRAFLAEAGLGKALLEFIASCCENREAGNGLEEALGLLYAIKGLIGPARLVPWIGEARFLESLIWGFKFEFKLFTAHALKVAAQAATPSAMENLSREFFAEVAFYLREGEVVFSRHGINALLHVLLEACPWGQNRVLMVESGFVFLLVELELACPDRKTTELALGVLYQLCSCADGRAAFLSHAGGVAAVTARILRVSAAADEWAVMIVWLVCRYAAATGGVVQELLRVGTVERLCMVIQVERTPRVKEKARDILRRYSCVWKDSPCFPVQTVSRTFTNLE